jgi:hypothetical protein
VIKELQFFSPCISVQGRITGTQYLHFDDLRGKYYFKTWPFRVSAVHELVCPGFENTDPEIFFIL